MEFMIITIKNVDKDILMNVDNIQNMKYFLQEK